MRRLFGDQRGTSAVEFALIVSLVFMVLFGIIQFGIAFNRYQSINAASREGARIGSLPNTQVGAIQNRVLESLSILSGNRFRNGNSSSGTVRSSCPASLGVEEGCIEVRKETAQGSGVFGSPLTGASDVACDQSQQGAAIQVSVRYRMRITIPLWASPVVNATGSGVFRCE